MLRAPAAVSTSLNSVRVGRHLGLTGPQREGYFSALPSYRLNLSSNWQCDTDTELQSPHSCTDSLPTHIGLQDNSQRVNWNLIMQRGSGSNVQMFNFCTHSPEGTRKGWQAEVKKGTESTGEDKETGGWEEEEGKIITEEGKNYSTGGKH